MDDYIWDLVKAFIGIVFGKVLDLGIQALKEKTSRKPGKHEKRS